MKQDIIAFGSDGLIGSLKGGTGMNKLEGGIWEG
jgi:hypothetical protein